MDCKGKIREHIASILPFKILEAASDKPLRISGVAMAAGMSRNFNVYTTEELQSFAPALVGAPVYIEHVAVDWAAGKVTKCTYDQTSRCLLYEAEIYDLVIADKIRNGLIQHVSVGADYDALDVVDAKIPHGLSKPELSLVAVPGIPETNIQVFEHLKENLAHLDHGKVKLKVKEALGDAEVFCVFCSSPADYFVSICQPCVDKFSVSVTNFVGVKKMEDKEIVEISEKIAAKIEVGKIRICDLPVNIEIIAFDDFCNQWIFHDDESKGHIHRTKAIPYYNWKHKYSVQTYGLKFIETIKSWLPEGTVEFDSGDNERDGENFYIWYFVKIDETATLREVIAYERNLEGILESQTEALLSKGELSQDILNNEVSFSLGVFLPLLRKMDYENPQYNHGPREFGKDIVFSDIDKLGIRRNFSVQVKAGDISGEASGQLDKIIAQIDDALKMSYNDIYSKEKRLITDVLIVITRRFVGNAQDKICEKLKNHNVHFIDIDKIQSLLVKYMSEENEK